MILVSTIALSLFMLTIAVFVVFTRSVFTAIIAMSVFSVVLSTLFVLLRAPDVAMTEAVIGAGMITAFLIIALDKTRPSKSEDTDSP